MKISELRPTQRCWLYGNRVEVERQCRRTTMVRVVRGQLKGARLQVKRSMEVERYAHGVK